MTWLISLFSPLQSGSQNDLVDSWTAEEEQAALASAAAAAAATTGQSRRASNATRNGRSAEYPFHMNMCMTQHGVNFDLSHRPSQKFSKKILAY